MLTLRPYQREAVDALYAYWSEGGGNPLIVLPTGAGKSLVIATIVRELLEKWPRLRIGIVTHTKELIRQNYVELIRLWPQAPAGIFSAGVGRYDAHAQILICGVQSAYRRVKTIGGFDVLIVDECHLIPRSSDTMYGQFISGLQDTIPDMRIVGLTATEYRMDSGRLDQGEGAIFDKIVYEANVSDLIRDGYLSPLISRASLEQADVSGVKIRGGEYIAGELEAAAMRGDLVQRAVADLVRRAENRKAWLAFCCGIDHAMAVRDALRAHGIAAEAVHGQTPDGERNAIVQGFRDGRIRCLASVNLLSIGFNVPQVDLIALMRPTRSAGLFVQQVGRAFRRAPGKENALILDFSGNVKRFGPVDAVAVPEGPKARGSGKDQAEAVMAKECPDCESLVAIAARTCSVCGHDFPHAETPKHEAEADDTPILSTEKRAPELIPVVSWSARRHIKEGSPDSLLITYFAGLQSYREWVCFEHQGSARDKAERWWRRHGGGDPPATVGEAIRRFGELTPPASISVRKNGRWFDIVGRHVPTEAAA